MVLANLDPAIHIIQTVLAVTRLDVHLALQNISLMLELGPAKSAQKSTIPIAKLVMPIPALVASLDMSFIMALANLVSAPHITQDVPTVISVVASAALLAMPGTKETIPANNAQSSLGLAVIIAISLNAIIVILDMSLLQIALVRSEIAQHSIQIARLVVKLDVQPVMMDMPWISEQIPAKSVLNSTTQIVISAHRQAVLAAMLVSHLKLSQIVLAVKPVVQMIVMSAIKKTVKLAVLTFSMKRTPANWENVPFKIVLNAVVKAAFHAIKGLS